MKAWIISFRTIWETWATPGAAEYLMFLEWKSKILVCLWCIFSKIFGVKNKDTILFTDHFDLGWKENSL